MDRTDDTLAGALARYAGRWPDESATVALFAELLGDVIGEEGWRDRMQRLHGMAHTVINDAGFAGAADETLPELASEITGQMREAIARLETWIQRIEPLEELAARD